MKNSAKLLALVAALIIALSGCSDKEDPKTKQNVIIVDGTEFAVTQALTEEYGGDETSGYNFDLLILSSGFDFSDYENSWVTGSGNVLYLELWSTSSTGLVTGTYTSSANFEPNTFTSSYVGINYDTSDDTADQGYEDGTGSVSITVSGSTYTVNFDLTFGATKVTGNYTGTVSHF